MKQITALTVQKKNRQRVNVFLDGEFAFGLARITAAWLHLGQELSDEKIAQLIAEDALEVAFQQALKLLNYRARTETEIRQKLSSHSIPEENIEKVLERLRENGLVNDARFAETWVENQSEFRPRGRRSLAFELKQRGVDRETIDQTLQDLDEDELAYQAARKAAAKLQNLDKLTFRKKLYGHLARRGFGYEVCGPVVDRVWEEMKSHTPLNETQSDEEVTL